jgi:hypothetical protein
MEAGIARVGGTCFVGSNRWLWGRPIGDAGVGFEATTASVAVAEVPPPGAGFTAVRERLAATDKSAAVSARLTWVELMKVVARSVPLT